MVYIISITAGLETKKPGLIPGMESGIHGLHQPFLAENQHGKTYGAREHTQETENHSGIHSCVGHCEGAGVGDANRKSKIVRRQLSLIDGFFQQLVPVRGFGFRQAVL